MSILIKDKEIGVCIETHCKAKQERLYFCNEHFEQFKFGVIRKNGTHPSDHERKSDQYKRFLLRQTTDGGSGN